MYQTASGPRWRALAFANRRRKALGSHRTEEQARKALSDFYRTLDAGGGVDTKGPPSLSSWAPEWHARRVAEGLHRTTEDTKCCIRRRILPHAIAKVPLVDLTPKMVKAWVREQSATPTNRKRRPRRQTIVNSLNTLRVILRDAIEEELIVANPAAGIRVPKEARSDETWTVLSLDEVRRVLAASCLSDSNRNCVAFAAFTGCRAGECFGLRWEDVDFEGRMLSIRFSFDGPTKAGKPRKVPMLNPVYDALIAQRTLAFPGQHVFPGREPGSKKHEAVAQFKAACKEAGITRNVRYHDLRHTHCSNLINGGYGKVFTLNQVKELAGHASIMTTMRYAHMSEGGVAKAVHEVSFTL